MLKSLLQGKFLYIYIYIYVKKKKIYIYICKKKRGEKKKEKERGERQISSRIITDRVILRRSGKVIPQFLFYFLFF